MEQMVCKDAPVIRIQTLGQFRIVQNEAAISDSCNRTRQVWNLLEYLVTFRTKEIPQEELIEALWPNGSSDNPANALKNLVYRIRTMFEKYGFERTKELIQFHNGSYRWNVEMPCEVDAELFEELVIRARQEEGTSAQLACYMRALRLYKGDFLPASRYERWVASRATQLRAIYFRCVYNVSELLARECRFEEMRDVCEKAVRVDSFEERAHRYLIYAMIKLNCQKDALEHYNYVTDLFYRELGTKPSEAIRSLYREIVKTVNNVQIDLDVIREDLREHSLVEGAYACDYEVFKNMYRVEVRSASRSGQTVFIGLLTVMGENNEIPELRVLGQLMDALHDDIRESLRKGDVFSRFSATQYVVMLSTVTYESGRIVLERICKRYKYMMRSKEVRLHMALQPLGSVEE